jgi:hypothetical protein
MGLNEDRQGMHANPFMITLSLSFYNMITLLLLWIITNGNSSVSDFVEIRESMLTKLRKIKSSLLFLNAFMIWEMQVSILSRVKTNS